MARHTSTWLAASACLTMVPLAAGGCVDDSASLRIDCAVVPESSGDSCTWSEEGECVYQGNLNLAATNHYTAVLRLVSGLFSRRSDIPVQAEPNGIGVDELEIELMDTAGRTISFTSGQRLPNPFRVATSGFADPSGGGLVTADLIPPAYAAQLAESETSARPLGQVIVQVVARGKTQGDVKVESGPWKWPVRLVLVDPNDADVCVPFEDAVCTPGQDGYFAACAPGLSGG